MSGSLRSGRYVGVLRDPGRGFLRGLVPSIVIHVLLGSTLAVAGMFEGDREPLFDKDIYIVSAVTLPRADGLPDKFVAPPPEPEPPAANIDVPAPVDSEMVLPEPAVDPEPSTPKPEPATPKLEPPTPKAKTSVSDALARVSEDVGEARPATDPDGDVNAPISWEAFDGKQKTAYQRRLEGRLLDHWNPGSMAGKFVARTGNIDSSLKAVVEFRIKENGAFTAPGVYRRSGDALYDQSCLSAIMKVRRFDPPPEGEPRIFMLMCSAEELE